MPGEQRVQTGKAAVPARASQCGLTAVGEGMSEDQGASVAAGAAARVVAATAVPAAAGPAWMA